MSRPFEPVSPPPLSQQEGRTFPRLVELMQRLLAPDGCPWDREQTLPSLRRYVLEEACEVIDAIDGGDRAAVASAASLGDLLLQVVFQAELARAEGAFGPDDVVAAICDKLVRRHPHVFADVPPHGVDGAADRAAQLGAHQGGAEARGPTARPTARRRTAACSAACRGACRRSRVRSASGRRWSVSASTGRMRAGRAPRSPRSWASSTRPSPRATRTASRPSWATSSSRLCNLARHVEVDAEGALPAHHRHQVHPPLRPRRAPRPRAARGLARLHRGRQAHPRGEPRRATGTRPSSRRPPQARVTGP